MMPPVGDGEMFRPWLLGDTFRGFAGSCFNQPKTDRPTTIGTHTYTHPHKHEDDENLVFGA